MQRRAHDRTVETLLAGVICRRRDALAPLLAVDPAHACRIAEEHGLVGLVADALDGIDRQEIQAGFRDSFVERAQALAVIDLVRESALRSLLAALRAAAIDVLLMKGVQLAYSLYPRPDLRPRLDTDLLVAGSARQQAETVLRQCGYRAVPEQQEGELLMYQSSYVKVIAGTRHTVDLHWRALNPQVFADVLDYQALAAASVEVPRLDRGVRGLGGVHALLLACVHRIAHHRVHRPLIWVYDIHLLASACDPAAWQRFLLAVEHAGVGPLCQDGLRLAAATFATTLPAGLLEDHRLTKGAGAGIAGYLQSKRYAQLVLNDLRSLPDWTSRTRLVLQYLFPRAEYMRQTYAPGSRLPLGLLYLIRVWRGGRRWLAKGEN